MRGRVGWQDPLRQVITPSRVRTHVLQQLLCQGVIDAAGRDVAAQQRRQSDGRFTEVHRP